MTFTLTLFLMVLCVSPPPPHLQHQLGHLEPLLQAFVGGQRLVVEEAQQVVSLQGLLVVALVDVQHPVLPVKIGELKTFLSTAKRKQAKAKAREQRETDLVHCCSVIYVFPRFLSAEKLKNCLAKMKSSYKNVIPISSVSFCFSLSLSTCLLLSLSLSLFLSSSSLPNSS